MNRLLNICSRIQWQMVTYGRLTAKYFQYSWYIPRNDSLTLCWSVIYIFIFFWSPCCSLCLKAAQLCLKTWYASIHPLSRSYFGGFYRTKKYDIPIELIYSHPHIDGKVNHHWISRDLLFHLFGDEYMYIYIYIYFYNILLVSLCSDACFVPLCHQSTLSPGLSKS